MLRMKSERSVNPPLGSPSSRPYSHGAYNKSVAATQARALQKELERVGYVRLVAVVGGERGLSKVRKEVGGNTCLRSQAPQGPSEPSRALASLQGLQGIQWIQGHTAAGCLIPAVSR